MDFEKIKKIGDRKPKITPNIENLEKFKKNFDSDTIFRRRWC